MAVIPTPSSGPIDAIDINRALDRADTTTMSMNGSAERALAEVPSGQISFSDFYDKPAAGVVMTDQSSLGFAFSGTATGGALFQSNGEYYRNLNFSYTQISGEWYDTPAAGVGSDYQIRATQVSSSGVASRVGPTLGVWHSLSSNRHWYISTTTSGNKTWVLDIEIRDATTLAVLGSARYTLNAEVSPF
jgi:hypothetical protein